MAIQSIYINLEDDVTKIFARLKKERSNEVVLVCPKRCFLFNDSINLRLLKKQVDMLGKQVWILTMDEKGQLYAKEAGFGLKFLPKTSKTLGFSDISLTKKSLSQPSNDESSVGKEPKGMITEAVNEIKNIGNIFKPKEKPKSEKLENLHANHQTVKKTSKVVINDNIFSEEIAQLDNATPKYKKNRKLYLVLFLFVCMPVVSAIFFIVLPKAEIVILPKHENLVRDIEISSGVAIKAPDSQKLVLPAINFSETHEVNEKFQSQGKKEVGNKASGTLKIYNFTKSPINLKANTTVFSVGTKIYRLTEDAMQIKPTVYKNAVTKEVDEESLSGPYEVIAEHGGESFNLPSGTRVEITNQVFGSRPQLLYSKSYSAITGGTSRYLSLVSEDDISKSREALLKLTLKKINDKLSQTGHVLVEKAFSAEIIDFKTDKIVGSETPAFEGMLKVKITGLSFSDLDLKKLVNERISQTLASNKVLPTEPGAVTYKVEKLDPVAELMILKAHYSGEVYYSLDLKGIGEKIKGQNPNLANEIIREGNEIDKIDINLSPSWQRNLPFWVKRIKIVTQKQ